MKTATQSLERVEFFEANGIGQDTYSLLSNLLAPTKLAAMHLQDLMETLRKYFEAEKGKHLGIRLCVVWAMRLTRRDYYQSLTRP